MGVNMEYIVNGKPYEVVIIKKRNKIDMILQEKGTALLKYTA